MNVFISFAKEDKSKVARLEEIVRHGGGKGWQFVYDLHGARDWRSEIQYRIDRCEVFLFVITNNSLQSEWCNKELQHAALSGKPIVTVVFTSDINIPYPLNTIQYILLDETPEAGAKLVRALQDPRPISHDEIPPDWKRLGGGPMGFPMGFPTSFQSQIPIPRMKRELTDVEKEDFLYEAIKKVRNYFGQALNAFEKSDSRIRTRIRDKSDSDFECRIYNDGKLTKACRIRVDKSMGLGIAYSEARGNMAHYDEMRGMNELATVSQLDGSPALEFTLGLTMFAKSTDCQICTVDQACERFWTHFVRDFGMESTW